MMKTTPEKNNGRSCLICGTKSEGANSGVESCRACSAFFRRSVSESMKYVCKNELKCDLKRAGKRLCRACRLRRCLEVGMLPEHVKTATRPSSQDPATPGPSKPIVENDEFLKLNESRIPLLCKIGTLYHRSRSRRFYSELSLLPIEANKPSPIADPVDAQQLHPCDVVLADNLWKTNLRFITEFCTDTFEEFAILEKTDKFDLFRSFIATLFIFELEEATAMKNLELDYKRQMSRTTYLDFKRPELFFSNRESTADQKFLETWSETCSNPMHYRVLAAFRSLSPSVIERAAIIALLFWNVDDLDMSISEGTLALCNTMRSRIMHELHVYYTDILRKDDYCLRLGRTLDHLHETIAHAREMRTELVMYVMIGAMQPDLTLFDLIRV
ncbi:hypothetical protein PENTCL1PPCAC_16895 [Pristionchus entomophagus]|uniref:Nuclear receptor n=1 Tax=Pristionchus entomophagus TaxID=358040 RepID=A0AAV5TK32_9BILA|nr:hypothetical protein PENTCL1PPCAC_16895 [Pristionchus entomophagus]